MPAGKFRHRIEVEDVENTDAGGGQAARSWVHLCWLWAMHVPRGAQEKVRGGVQRDAQVTHVFRVRRSAQSLQLKPTMRLKFDGSVLNLVTVRPADGRRLELELECKQVL